MVCMLNLLGRARLRVTADRFRLWPVGLLAPVVGHRCLIALSDADDQRLKIRF